MRIVIDMQGAQTESRFRGIGRYTMEFAQAVARNAGEHDIILALSGLFPETIEPIRAAFEGVLPQEKIRVWYAPGPVKEESPDNDLRREVAELLREAFLASLLPDIIHISSLFEGYVDDAVTSIGRFDQNTPISVTLYDLIPLMNPDHYLKPDPIHERYYRRKVEFLKKAWQLLAISNSSISEAIEYLVIPDSSFFNISGAVGSDFCLREKSTGDAVRLFEKYSITGSFVLYTGGADKRKNLPRLIRAYAALNKNLRNHHQLVLAGKMPEGDVVRLRSIAADEELGVNELLIIGYISDDELVSLYNHCKLYVFPSWHEGFGLPALEAMACGAAVIGANTSSLPELIGLPEALFDPFNVQSIATKLELALSDNEFRTRLSEHGLQQKEKFSWDETARRAFNAWEALQSKEARSVLPLDSECKKKLAFVSPLPPERTGIADYSAELLPELSKFYDIELVVAQGNIAPGVQDYGNVRDSAWLRENANKMDRVVYQMGNSPFHAHMLSLIEEVPGTVVLHDFFLSSLMQWLETQAGEAGSWTSSLYKSHGYAAVQEQIMNGEAAKNRYPVNRHVLEHARGIIVHSRFSYRLLGQWYGAKSKNDCCVIPLLRASAQHSEREKLRESLGLEEKDILVCSFGFIDVTKSTHKILDAWLNSNLSFGGKCYLTFVGENHGGDYGAELRRTIENCGLSKRINITGFASADLFKQYLAASDIAIQLRTQSLGETSASVLDCMNYGLPVIVNANGSMAELDSDSVYMLRDCFEEPDLIAALNDLYSSPEKRKKIGENARDRIAEQHDPEFCATMYAEALEYFHKRNANKLPVLVQKLSDSLNPKWLDSELVQIADSIGKNHPSSLSVKRLYLDITATCTSDLRTGIERVARTLTVELLNAPPAGYRVEPVYLSKVNGHWRYVHAHAYTASLLNLSGFPLHDDIAEVLAGDIVLGLDNSGGILIDAVNSGYIGALKRSGVRLYYMVYDLIPVRMPHVFPSGAADSHELWLRAAAMTDGVVGITRWVANDFSEWLEGSRIHDHRLRSFSVNYSHLGADIDSTSSSKGLPANEMRFSAAPASAQVSLSSVLLNPEKDICKF